MSRHRDATDAVSRGVVNASHSNALKPVQPVSITTLSTPVLSPTDVVLHQQCSLLGFSPALQLMQPISVTLNTDAGSRVCLSVQFLQCQAALEMSL